MFHWVHIVEVILKLKRLGFQKVLDMILPEMQLSYRRYNFVVKKAKESGNESQYFCLELERIGTFIHM